MNKAQKQRRRRSERDMRWLGRCNGVWPTGQHRLRKIRGLPLPVNDDDPTSFWCQDKDTTPRFARIFLALEEIRKIDEENAL